MKHLLARAILACALLISSLYHLQAQDPQYSQFFSNPVALNPAFTGTGAGHRVVMNYRAQWVNIPGFYNQSMVSYDQPMRFLGNTMGLGVSVGADRAGEGQLTKINPTLNYAYHIELARDHYLHFGLGVGFIQASIDPTLLRFPDQIDARQGFIFPTNEPIDTWNLNRIRPDVNFGAVYLNEYAFVGASVHHITQPDEVFTSVEGQDADATRLPRKYTVTAGLNIPIFDFSSRREMTISPVVLYKMQGQFRQIDVGVYTNIEPMVFGLWYRHQDAMVGLIGVRQGPFSFGYSFDYTISSLSQRISGGSHELSLTLEF
ncbi:MAG: type IX secretion system membrane protein PorP/SprF [Bacteroidota bacterium]